MVKVRSGDFTFLDALVDHVARLADALPDLERFRLMKVSSRPGPNLPLVFFLVQDGSDRPDYVLKVNRNPAYPDAVAREFRNFSAIYRRVAGEGLGMPRPIFCEPIDRWMVLGETWVPGRRCEDRFFSVRRGWWRRRAISRFLERAMAWAGEFHRRTRIATLSMDRARLEADFRQPLLSFAGRPDVGAGLTGRLSAFATTKMERLEGRSWPVTAVHGDFDHGNILLDGDRMSVVDWEDCETAGNPFVDLAYLIFHLALVSDLSLNRHRRLETFFTPDGWSHVLVRDLLARYAAAHGFEPELFFLALPLTVIQILTREWGPERDPRSIPLYSLDMLDYVVELAERELAGLRS